MPGKYEAPRGHHRKRRRRRRRNSGFLRILAIILVLAAVISALGIWYLNSQKNPADPTTPTKDSAETTAAPEATALPPETTTAPTETQPEPVYHVSSATVAVTGDLLMHIPVINSHWENGGYDFSRAFQFLDAYAAAADYAIANLETTLGGPSHKYSGFPCFNSPDEIVDGVVGAGFDMLLTANNHSYDTHHAGMLRTLKVIEERGLATLGTYSSADGPQYVVQEINGIRIGMVCYTYETNDGNPDRTSLNGLLLDNAAAQCINSFDYQQLNKFYEEMAEHIRNMEDEGAEAIMLFIHWGEEYAQSPSSSQETIAQKMCDLGVDVIVGGHPHVVQPMDLLTSTEDPDHKTVCIYSLGNALSNQNRYNISSTPEGHCEDGMLFSVTFSKYSNGMVVLEGTDVLPTWVNTHNDKPRKYNILPLDNDTREQWKELYAISDQILGYAEDSYNRTMALVGEGLEKCQQYLEAAKALRYEEYHIVVQPETADP